MSTLYRKEEVLGWGSVAAVYRGWDELLDRPVAVKELRQPFAGNEPFSRAFRAQALRMLDISHRNVLATYAVDSDRNIHAVVRELADETVGQKSFSGPLDTEEVLKIFRCILLGLDALHGRELLHRAIRPENIFLCGECYKLGDFGLSTVEGAPPFPPRRFRYSAPEEIRTPDLVSRESDLYSLGVLAYELILGPVRFEQVLEELLWAAGERREPGTAGESRDDLWPRFHICPLELPPLIDLEPSVPAAFSLTLRKLTAKEPGARFATCRQVLASLGAANPELPTGAQRFSIELTSPRPAANENKGWAWIAGGALATSGLLALAVWGLIAFRPPSGPHTPEVTPRAPAAVPEEPISLESRLAHFAGSESGATVSLDPPRAEAIPRLPVGTPLRFRVTADRNGYLLLFNVSSDGTITCLYPNAHRPSLAISAGQSLLLPTSEDEQIIPLEASLPAGQESIFILHSSHPLPPLPTEAQTFYSLSRFPFDGRPDDPASRFVDWVSKLLRERQEARLAVARFEVEAAR